jgi:hypothetical protein
MKVFLEALKDSFLHIKEINNKDLIQELREEGVQIDAEGYYSFSFGDHKEFELAIEPIGPEGQFQIALYKNRVKLIDKLPIWIKTN